MSAPGAEPRFTVRLASWSRDEDALRRVRREVFVVEQRVPESLEWDEIDPACRHVLAEDRDRHPIGCGRLLPDGHIGRIAVLSPWRERGVGSAMLHELLELARSLGYREAMLNSQTQAMPFYARLGFAPYGEPFEEAGIPHQPMRRTLDAGW